MAKVPTVTLYRAGAYIICNADDQERFLAQGWSLQKQEEPKPAAPQAPKKPK